MNFTILERPKKGPDPVFDLLNRPTIRIAMVIPGNYNRMNPWDLGRIARKKIRARLEEMRNHPSIRRVVPSVNEMIVAIKVPNDFDTMGNWDLGAFLKYQVIIRENNEEDKE